MRREDDDIAVWLVAFHGELAEGVAALGELGIGPEDARRTLAMVPLQLAVLSTGSANQVAATLQAVGATVELRRLRAPSPRTPRTTYTPRPVETAGPPAWKRALRFFGVAALVLLGVGVVGALPEGLRSAVRSSSVQWLFTSSTERNLDRGLAEEAREHRDDPVVSRLFQGVARGDADIEDEATRAHLRGLQYLSHDELVRFFHGIRRVLSGRQGCDPEERTLDVLSEAEQLDLGRLIGKTVVLGARERPPTGGHERALQEGVRFAYRRLPSHEQPGFEALAGRARTEGRARCEWTRGLLESTDAMHPDLQRRFLRAFAYHIGKLQLDALDRGE